MLSRLVGTHRRSPVERVSVLATPRSMPTLGQILTGASCSISQAKLTCQPSGSSETVTFFTVPRIGRVSRNLTHPIFSKHTADHLRLNRLVSTSGPGERKLSLMRCLREEE